MPMATERFDYRRRKWLAAIAATPLLAMRVARAAPAPSPILVASWANAAGRFEIGVIRLVETGAEVLECIEAPTRAHGLACTPDGQVIAVSRRPGDWIVRWQPGGEAHWTWAGDERRFSGHLQCAPDGKSVFTTEIDQDSGDGVLVQRDAITLEDTAAWPTGGHDPHDLEWLDAHHLLVANGGIETLPETGRVKRNLEAMDASLVLVDTRTGEHVGLWRLPDPRLSIRHLARHESGRVGVALQAEHDDAARRSQAPLFATFDPASGTFVASSAVRTRNGYSGDITATDAGWVLSCPKDDCIFTVDESANVTRHAIAQGCALVTFADGSGAWALGDSSWLALSSPGSVQRTGAVLHFDNHALLR